MLDQIPLPFFPMHPEYSQLLSGAHRKPATPVGFPALVCHLAFWQPADDLTAARQAAGAQWTIFEAHDPNTKKSCDLASFTRAHLSALPFTSVLSRSQEFTQRQNAKKAIGNLRKTVEDAAKRDSSKVLSFSIDDLKNLTHDQLQQIQASDSAECASYILDLIDNQWKNAIDDYLLALFRRLQKFEGFDCPNIDGPSLGESKFLFLIAHAIKLDDTRFNMIPAKLFTDQQFNNKRIDAYFDSEYKSIVFNFKWHHVEASLSFAKHQEYLLVTSYLDLGYEPVRDGILIDPAVLDLDDTYRRLRRELRLLEQHTYQRSPRKAETDRRDPEVPADPKKLHPIDAIHRYLYEDIWEEFFKDTLLCRAALSGPPSFVDVDGTVSDEYKSIGNVFADFRGLILGAPAFDDCSEPGAVPSEAGNHFSTRMFCLPAWRRRDQPQRKLNAPRLTSDNGKALVEDFWSFLTCEPRVQLRKMEFSVSLMIGERALYVTALGAQPSPYVTGSSDQSRIKGQPDERQPDQLPVYYFAYVTTPSRWQIGRLIDRINNLGTFRIAAIQELKTLRDKSNSLRKVSAPIDHEFSRVQQDAAKHATDVKRIGELISVVQSTLSVWNTEFSGGMMYRIERSRYYVKQFYSGLSALRIARVERYQSYDVFVQHRLGATFDFVDRLGIRLERLERRLDALHQYVLTNLAIKNERFLVDLQRKAEFFFLLIAAPYYLGSVLDHFMPALDVWVRSRGVESAIFNKPLATLVPFAVAFLFSFAVWLWARRARE